MIQKRFAVFDIDGTLIRWQMYHAIADASAKRGLIDPGAHQSVREARMQWKERSGEDAFKAYETLLVQEFDSLIAQLDYTEFMAAVEDVFREYKDQVYTYTRDLIRKLKSEGYILFAISGSQDEIVGKIANYWSFDDFVGTSYEKVDGKFTGKLTHHSNKKHLIVKGLADKHGLTYARSIAVGDSEGDITMLEAVENPIAFNPTKKLFTHAKEKGWKIVIERKNMVYELEVNEGKYFLK